MRQMSVEPTVATFGMLLRACEKLHALTAAERFLGKMKEMKALSQGLGVCSWPRWSPTMWSSTRS